MFEKGCTPRWTEEVFTILGVIHTNPITYKITDLNGEEIQGSLERTGEIYSLISV